MREPNRVLRKYLRKLWLIVFALSDFVCLIPYLFPCYSKNRIAENVILVYYFIYHDQIVVSDPNYEAH